MTDIISLGGGMMKPMGKGVLRYRIIGKPGLIEAMAARIAVSLEENAPYRISGDRLPTSGFGLHRRIQSVACEARTLSPPG